jgi:hypothetical protein
LVAPGTLHDARSCQKVYLFYLQIYFFCLFI